MLYFAVAASCRFSNSLMDVVAVCLRDSLAVLAIWHVGAGVRVAVLRYCACSQCRVAEAAVCTLRITYTARTDSTHCYNNAYHTFHSWLLSLYLCLFHFSPLLSHFRYCVWFLCRVPYTNMTTKSKKQSIRPRYMEVTQSRQEQRK